MCWRLGSNTWWPPGRPQVRGKQGTGAGPPQQQLVPLPARMQWQQQQQHQAPRQAAASQQQVLIQASPRAPGT